ncbi:MAG: hypothetical protein ACYS8W_02695 [Planctomycetota bacterium]|jgi:hypothetical protein
MTDNKKASVLESGKETPKKPAKKKRGRRRFRRLVKGVSPDGIYGKFIGRPPGPAEWWGPSSVEGAVGRTMILLGLLCIFVMVGYAVEYYETGVFSETGMVQVGPFLMLQAKYIWLIMLMLELFLIPVGIGFLWRREWAISYLRFMFAPSALIVLVMSLWSFREAVFWGGVRNIHHDQFGTYAFWGMLARGFIYLFFFAGFALPLLLYWNIPHAKYNFSYVNHGKVESLLFRATGWFGICLSLVGGALLLAGFALSHFGVPIDYMGYDKVVTMWPQHLIIIGAAACAIWWTIAFGFRLYLFVPACAVVTGALVWGVLVWTQQILPACAGNYYNRHNAGIDFRMLLSGSFTMFPAFMFVVLGLGFWKKSNRARLILQFLSLVMIPLIYAGAAPGVIRDVKAGLSDPMGIEISGFVWIFVRLMGLLVFAYIFFEVFRFMRSDKAKAHCGAGTYELPWKHQLVQIQNEIEEREKCSKKSEAT